MKKHKILNITPISHIKGVRQELRSLGELIDLDNPSAEEVSQNLTNIDIIFTNPNKSKVFLGEDILKHGNHLKMICTASTGLAHIDLDYCRSKDIRIVSLTKDIEFMNQISSTAEHAFALMLSSLRRIPQAYSSVKNGDWDYEKFIGRQLSHISFGIIGLGRLGTHFARFCLPFSNEVSYFDPYVDNRELPIMKTASISCIASSSDVISIHVHVNNDTKKFINRDFLSLCKTNVLIVNTSRGELVDEIALIDFLKSNPSASYATDVISDEIRNRTNSPIIEFAKTSNQILVTPHIAGMTVEAQQLAYNRAVHLLKEALFS